MALSLHEEQRRLALYEQGLSDVCIAQITGLKIRGVQKWREKHRLPANRDSDGSVHAERSRQYRQCYESGLNDFEIAGILHVLPSTVTKWRKRRGLPSNARRKRKGPISASECRERITLYESGKTDAEIAKELGLNRSSISQWRRRKGLPTQQQRQRSLVARSQ